MEPSSPRTVRFHVGDLVHPRPALVLLELYLDLTLEGEVAAATSDGETAYLVVRVPGLTEAVIVPRDRVRLVPKTACAPT